MDEMIQALTHGTGALLGKEVRVSFFEQKRALERVQAFQNLEEHQKTLLIDLLALSVFHQLVILPLHGSLNFMRDTQRLGVSSVVMGSYSLDASFVSTDEAITKSFFAILKKYGINVSTLRPQPIDRFIKSALEMAR